MGLDAYDMLAETLALRALRDPEILPWHKYFTHDFEGLRCIDAIGDYVVIYTCYILPGGFVYVTIQSPLFEKKPTGKERKRVKKFLRYVRYNMQLTPPKYKKKHLFTELDLTPHIGGPLAADQEEIDALVELLIQIGSQHKSVHLQAAGSIHQLISERDVSCKAAARQYFDVDANVPVVGNA